MIDYYFLKRSRVINYDYIVFIECVMVTSNYDYIVIIECVMVTSISYMVIVFQSVLHTHTHTQTQRQKHTYKDAHTWYFAMDIVWI